MSGGAGRQRGQAMTEFIIVVPVLILLIFGAVQIGFIWSAKTPLNYATFQAARLGAVNQAGYDSIRRGLIRSIDDTVAPYMPPIQPYSAAPVGNDAVIGV